jgi:hypothetical protein
MNLRILCFTRGPIASHKAPQNPELRGNLGNCMRGIYDSMTLVSSYLLWPIQIVSLSFAAGNIGTGLLSVSAKLKIHFMGETD